MKHIQKLKLLVVLGVITLGYSCITFGLTGIIDPEWPFMVSSDYSKIDDENIEIIFSIEFKERVFTKRDVLSVTPLIYFSNDTLKLRTVKYQGEKVHKNYQIISYKEGGIVSWVDSCRVIQNGDIELYMIFKLENLGRGKSRKLQDYTGTMLIANIK